MVSIKYLTKLLSLIFIFSAPTALSFSGFLYIDIKGEVVDKPCSVNNGRLIEIDFGDVLTTRIQGEYYKKPVEYTVTCDGQSTMPSLNILVDGISSDFDQKLLKTDVDGLGVLFKFGTQDFPIRTKRPFTFSPKPEISAVLVKNKDTELPARKFTANATLKVSYQ